MATYLPNITDVIPEPALFTPDFSFLDTMLRRRQGLYEQGFAQVNSAYNFVNRSVTNPYSSKVRDTFLKQAQDNLKNLSSLDLSQQQNVKTAAGVFEPFVKNRGVLADMALTSHWDQQESIAESYRLKDGGKEYSDDNINYVRMQRQAFANDDISTVGDYYSSKRSFTPYYDWNKEIKDAMKEFKPSSTKIERINNMYMVTTKDASYTKEEINKYLGSVLSDKAKQQMRIEASVRYPDLNSVAGLYVSQAAEDLPLIDNRLSEVDVDLKTEKNQDRIKALQKERDFYTERAKEIRGNIQSIQQGDVSFLKKNAQKLAENIYVGQTVGRIANGFSHTDVEQTIGFNQVAMMYARMAFDAAENEKTRKAAKEELPMLPVQTGGENITTDINSLNSSISSAETIQRSKLAELKDVIVRTDPAYKGRSSSSLSQQELDKWIQNNQSNKELIEFVRAGQALDNAKANLENWNADAEKYAIEKMGPDWTRYQEYLKEKDKVKATMAKPTVNWNPQTGTYIETRPGVDGTPTIRDIGRVYQQPMAQDNTRVAANSKLLVLPQQVAANKVGLSLNEGMALDNKFNKLKQEFNSQRNTVVTQTRSGFTLNVTDPRYKNTKGYLEALTGLEGKISGIKWFPSSTDFQIQFNLDDANATNPVDRNTVKNNLIATLGTQDVTYNENTNTFTVGKIGPTVAPRLDLFGGIDPLHREILSNLEVYNGSPGSSRTSTMFNIQGAAGMPTFYIEKLFTNTPSVNKYILYVNGKAISNTFGSTLEAYSTAYGFANNPQALGTILNTK